MLYPIDVVKELLHWFRTVNLIWKKGYCAVRETDEVTVGELKELITSFKNSRTNLSVPNLARRVEKNLYSTYLSFLPEDEFSYFLKMNVDDRGSFTEFCKTKDHGQVSAQRFLNREELKGKLMASLSTKNEKFLVVSGEGVIRFISRLK